MNQITNRMKIGVGFFLLASLFLTGCATGPRFTAAPAPAPGKALVYVYRKSNFVGCAGYDRVYVNGNFLTELFSGGYAPCEVPPGPVVFSVTPKASLWINTIPAALSNLDTTKYEKLRIEAEAGKTYYINLYIEFIGHQMKLVDEATGAKQIRSLKLSETGKAE